MIRFFRGSGAGPVSVMILAALALWAEYFISPPQLPVASDSIPMPLWGLLSGPLYASPLLSVILSFLFVLAVVIVMVRFNTSIFFIPRRSFLPGLLYLMLFSVFHSEMVLNTALPASLLILAGIWRMISSYRVNGMTFNFFDAALLISSAGLIYAGSVWFILLVFIGALVLRSPDARELTLAFIGALLPWVLMYAVWYITGGDPGDLTEIIRHNLFDRAPSVYWSRTLIILLIILGISFLASLIYLARELPTYKIRSRKTFELFIWTLVISAAAFILVPAVSAEIMAVASLPIAFILANHLAFTRRTVVAEILFWLTAVMIAVSRIWPQ
ncbi:MAG: DUF6427 family protein [Bacteroidales bacterium]